MRPATNQTRFTVGGAVLGWAVCFLVANLLNGIVVQASGNAGEPSSTWPIWVTIVSLLLLWTPFLVLLAVFSRRFGTGRWRDDYRLSFRPVDLIGIPIGVLSQLVLVPLVYWPLDRWFPDTFDDDKIEQRARELWDRAHGGWLVVLVLMVAVGAPIVEELVYRGLIQQTLQSRIDDVLAVIVSAAFFAAVHFEPIELPGLFAFGIVLGVCFLKTGRLACPIIAHMAFNAVGLAIAAGS